MVENCSRFQRGVLVALSVLVAALGLDTGEASAGPKPVKPCISPTEVNLNERWGISDAIIAPFPPPFSCAEVNSGRRWVVSNAWFMNTMFESESVPSGFVPAGDTPVEDFIAKFVGVKYVVDAGTKHEKTYVVPSDDSLGVVNAPPFDVVNPATLGSLKPSSVGDHVVDSYFLLSAMHCDGLPVSGDETPEDHCLPAGQTFYQRVEFTVIPGHN